MRLRFTKMQGAGNDFIVFDATHTPLALNAEQMLRLGDRRFGVGADQILFVERSSQPGVDFRYRIFNAADGEEVEHCGNGARCFVRYVREQGLTDQTTIRVETVNNLLILQAQPDGRVTVDMNQPTFDPIYVPFDTVGLVPTLTLGFEQWPIELDGQIVPVAVLSIGNPHAILRVDNIDTAPVPRFGPMIESHPRFPRRVNAGFLQVVSRKYVRLRVYERSAGETLACGTGACAAVVAGIRLGWLDACVDVETRGGLLRIEWAGNDKSLTAPVLMTGPAETVFEGEIEL